MLDALGLHVPETIPKCDKGHEMSFERGDRVYIQYKGLPACNYCTNEKRSCKNTHHHDFFYHCGKCNDDFCRAHVLIHQGLLHMHTQKVSVHEHGLFFKNDLPQDFICHGGNLKGGCKGFSENQVSRRHMNFRCEKCLYDLCFYCVMAYK